MFYVLVEGPLLLGLLLLRMVRVNYSVFQKGLQSSTRLHEVRNWLLHGNTGDALEIPHQQDLPLVFDFQINPKKLSVERKGSYLAVEGNLVLHAECFLVEDCQGLIRAGQEQVLFVDQGDNWREVQSGHFFQGIIFANLIDR